MPATSQFNMFGMVVHRPGPPSTPERSGATSMQPSQGSGAGMEETPASSQASDAVADAQPLPPPPPPPQQQQQQQVQQEQQQQQQQQTPRDRFRDRGTVRLPTRTLTCAQQLYIFGVHGFMSMVISGGVNFGIAYAMYAHTPSSKSINLWAFPLPLAGDAAVTIILQTIITWAAEAALVQLDLKAGRMSPTLRYAPHDALVKWFVNIPGYYPGLLNTSGQPGEYDGPVTAKTVAKYVGGNLARLAVVVVFGMLIFWGPAVGIVAETGRPVGKTDFSYEPKWTPEVFKLLLGALYGFFLSSGLTWLWMVRLGMEYRRRYPIHHAR